MFLALTDIKCSYILATKAQKIIIIYEFLIETKYMQNLENFQNLKNQPENLRGVHVIR